MRIHIGGSAHLKRPLKSWDKKAHEVLTVALSAHLKQHKQRCQCRTECREAADESYPAVQGHAALRCRGILMLFRSFLTFSDRPRFRRIGKRGLEVFENLPVMMSGQRDWRCVRTVRQCETGRHDAIFVPVTNPSRVCKPPTGRRCSRLRSTEHSTFLLGRFTVCHIRAL